jgi:putative phosphoribosyl transferase
MLFRDRIDAGRRLGKALLDYAYKPDAIIIALPRGGVVVGFEVSALLHLPLDIVCPRKISAPMNPELAIGAVTETGEGIISHDLIHDLGIMESYLKTEIEQEKKKAEWRLAHYRKGRSPRNLKEKHVILVDDGLATGATMRAAIATVKAEQAKEIILAVPVAPPDTLTRLEKEVNKTVCLATPPLFYAVGQFYQLFDQTSDEEVVALLEKSTKTLKT